MVRHPLHGSEHAVPEDTHVSDGAHPVEQIRTLLQLHQPNEAELDARLLGCVHTHAAGTPPSAPLAREEWATQFGATTDDIDAVRTFAHEHDLQVVEMNVVTTTVMLTGSVGQSCRVLDTHPHHVAHDSYEYRGRSGPLRLPELLQNVIVAVLGLDSRPRAQLHLRFAPLLTGSTGPEGIRPMHAAPTTSCTPMQPAQLCGSPQGDSAD